MREEMERSTQGKTSLGKAPAPELWHINSEGERRAGLADRYADQVARSRRIDCQRRRLMRSRTVLFSLVILAVGLTAIAIRLLV